MSEESASLSRRRRAQNLAINSRIELEFEVRELAAEMLAEFVGTRRSWWPDVIHDLFLTQEGLCGICRQSILLDDLHVDHIVPFAFGGGNEQANLQLVHPRCNLEKGTSVDPEVLLRHLEDMHMNR